MHHAGFFLWKDLGLVFDSIFVDLVGGGGMHFVDMECLVAAAQTSSERLTTDCAHVGDVVGCYC